MQKPAKLLVAVAMLFMLACSNLLAQLQVKLEDSSGYRDPNSYGGEFTADLSGRTGLENYILDNYSSSAKDGNGFQTFCIQINESFTANTTYNAEITSTISPLVQGAFSYITEGTAYLYSLFATGDLPDYTYSTTTQTKTSKGVYSREYTSDELQDAIWYLQGDITSWGDTYTTNSNLQYEFGVGGKKFNPATDPFVLLAEEEFGGTLTNAQKKAANGYDGVYVLELTSTIGNNPAQDQLVYCPVPEPATFAAGAILLVPLGWSLLCVVRKKNASLHFAANPVTVPLKTNCENPGKYPGCPSGP